MIGMFTFNMPKKFQKYIVRNAAGFAVWFFHWLNIRARPNVY
jgi:hypothetical protein